LGEAVSGGQFEGGREMIRIAVCDDNITEGENVCRLVEQCCKEAKAIYRINCFDHSKALWYEIDEGAYFDLFLLDIDMPELDGLELTGEIRRFLPDALVIFVTSYEKYVYDSFKVQPYRFLPKKCIGEMLPGAIRDALGRLAELEDKYLIIENQRGLEKVPLRRITHIWHEGKYAYIEKMDRNTAKVRKTLKQVYEELPAGDFCWVDRGCIVNLSNIEQITGEYIFFANGTRIDVNKEKLAGFKRTVHQYWIEKEGIKQ